MKPDAANARHLDIDPLMVMPEEADRGLRPRDCLAQTRRLTDLSLELRSPVALYLEALRVDPSDDRSRASLVRARAQWMEYSLHELPAGVLYGHDGATVDQCRELIVELTEFGEHVDRLGQREKYAELIACCQLHYPAYLDYLLTGRPAGSYAAYLQDHGIDPDRC